MDIGTKIFCETQMLLALPIYKKAQEKIPFKLRDDLSFYCEVGFLTAEAIIANTRRL